MELKQIGITLKKLRLNKGLTQLNLAKILNVSDKAISKWESGKGLPEIASLLNISDYFQISIDDLLRGKLASDEYTEFLYIMDASGSMYSVTEDVIRGFNAFISEQQLQEGRAFLTTVIFNHAVCTLYESKDISLVQDIDRESYQATGSTALFDAIGQSVIKLENRAKTKNVLVTIMTDGYENSSRYFTKSKIKRMIESQTSKGWEFVFAGANVDVDKIGEAIGIKKSHRLKFIADSVGIREIYTILSDISCGYRQTGKVNIEGKNNEVFCY